MLKNYIKMAFKVLLRRKFFTFISLFGVSLTLVVLMVLVALFDHTFGAYPPETKTDRTLGVFFVEFRSPDDHSMTNGFAGYGFLDRYVRTLPNVEKVSLYSFPTTAVSYKDGVPIASWLKRTDGEFWQILDFRFLEGGPFSPEDEKNRNFVAVINQTTARRFFGEAPAVGKFLDVDGQHFRVVGVVPDIPILRIVPFADIWVPISTAKTDSYRSQKLWGSFLAMVLARQASDFQMIKGEYRDVLKRVEFPDPQHHNKAYGEIETLLDTASRLFLLDKPYGESPVKRFMGWLIFLMVLFMLLPTINLVNINVSRIRERSSEIGVRKAFGASSLTLVGQFVVENVLLTLMGGALGFVLSYAVLHFISSTGLIPYAHFRVNYRIFLCGLGITLFFGLFSGVYPAWKMSRLHPAAALRGRG